MPLFGESLKAAREAAGMKQQELARRAGLSQAAVSKAESAKDISVAGRETTLARITRAVRVGPDPRSDGADVAAEAVGRAFDPSRHNARAVGAVIEAVQFRVADVAPDALASVCDALLSAWSTSTSTPERLLLAALVRRVAGAGT